MSSQKSKKRVHKFACSKCDFVYDPRQGADNAPPNTPFESLSGDWECPKCNAKITEFKKKYEVVEIDV